MSAERLQAAATRLREVAEAATPGPWEADPRGGVTGRFEGMTEVISESTDQAHADYIATMHPLVALALADWLDDVADDYAIAQYGYWSSCALTVADQVLRGEHG